MRKPSMQSERSEESGFSNTVHALRKRARNNRVHLEQQKTLKRQSQAEEIEALKERAEEMPDLKVIKSETARDVAGKNQKGNSTTVREFVQSAQHQKEEN